MTSAPQGAMTLLTNRRSVLDVISRGASDKQQIVEEVDVSRSTVDRAVRELEDAGLVERTRAGVSMTTSGRIALKSHDRLTDTIRGLGAASSLLPYLGSENPPDPVIFQGGTVIASTQEVPQRPTATLAEFVPQSEEVRGVALSVEPQMVEAGREAIVEGGVELTFAVPEAVVSRLLGAHTEALEAALEGGMDLRQIDASPDYGVLVFEREAGPLATLVVYGESGVRGIVTNEREPALAWARQYVETWIQRAEPL